MVKRWKILNAEADKVDALQQSLSIASPLCNILAYRGIDTFEKAKDYFRPQLSQLHDPYLMKDMEKAVQRILQAIGNNQKILVFGDYDVDGTTAVALVYRFLRKIYKEDNIGFYVPHRYREGYGVSKAGIDYACENGYQLVIALDCGIKSVDLIGYACSRNLDFIVCDHHLPDETLPPAVAILNAKQKDCNYPYKELCGCGVGFKLITALAQRLGIHEDEYFCYLDLVVTAIGADIVPMTGENRILAYYGLKRLNSSPCAGIKALKQLSISKKSAPVTPPDTNEPAEIKTPEIKTVPPFSITNVVFMIAPRVNAAGRMDDATKAVQLFIEDNEYKAMEYAEMLHSDNSDRKDADVSITEEALAMIKNDEKHINRNTTVLFQKHWHKGVVGIVASRLIETYHRPTVVLSLGEVLAGGSARSVPGFNLYEAIHACREHLIGYGGHFAAAGMTLHPENVHAFSEKFEEVVAATIDPALLIPELTIDAELNFKNIDARLFRIINQMEPYGPLNLRPVFITRNVFNTGSRIVKEKHIRFVVKNEGITFTGIGFNLADKWPLIEANKPIDIAYTLDENEWNGAKNLQLKIIDIRLSGSVTE